MRLLYEIHASCHFLPRHAKIGRSRAKEALKVHAFESWRVTQVTQFWSYRPMKIRKYHELVLMPKYIFIYVSLICSILCVNKVKYSVIISGNIYTYIHERIFSYREFFGEAKILWGSQLEHFLHHKAFFHHFKITEGF